MSKDALRLSRNETLDHSLHEEDKRFAVSALVVSLRTVVSADPPLGSWRFLLPP
jgi:hypothetical protein